MEIAPSTATTTAAPSTSAATAPSHGNRGRGRGSPRGGRGRGGDRGRGRGFAAHGDDRGRGRGEGSRGRGFSSRGGFKPARHRSLSGKHGAHPRPPSERPAKREKKDQKPNSNFALLHSLLGDAGMIAEYIRDYHASEKFRDPKLVNNFLQAISQRPEAVYEELMTQHKDAVFTTLERLFAIYALGKHTMFPPAHEFLLRCEQAGVRRSAWGEGVKTLPVKAPETDVAPTAEELANGEATSSPLMPTSVAPPLPDEAASLLSPRELLKKLIALDPVGRLHRIIELANTVEDVQVCARKLATLLSGEGEETNNGSEKFDFAARCQVISKLLSKARRVVEPALTPPPKAAEAEDEKGSIEMKEEVATEALQSAEGSDAHAEEEEEGSAAPAAPAPRRRRAPLTEEEIKTFQSALSVTLHVLETVLKERGPSVSQQPLSRFTKVLEWCKAQGLLASEDERFIATLEAEAESDLAQQAAQLETVITLKSLAAGDSAALTEVADQLWAAGESKCFSPSSVDVLSAIAVAASVPTISAAAKRLVAERLVQTQQHLADTVVLPRRALRFVNEERNKLKQAAITKQLDEEATHYGRKDATAVSAHNEEEEEDMALEKA